MQESQEFTGRLFLSKLNQCRMISPVVQERKDFGFELQYKPLRLCLQEIIWIIDWNRIRTHLRSVGRPSGTRRPLHTWISGNSKVFPRPTQSQYLVSVLGESDCPVRVDWLEVWFNQMLWDLSFVSVWLFSFLVQNLWPGLRESEQVSQIKWDSTDWRLLWHLFLFLRLIAYNQRLTYG